MNDPEEPYTDERNIRCGVCGATFYDYDAGREHFESEH